MGDFRGSENWHSYASPRTVEMGIAKYVGEPVETVPGASGNPVKPQTQHFQKYGLAPGVTSILNLMAKPQLVEWAAKKTAEAAYDLMIQWVRDRTGEYPKQEFVDTCVEAKDKVKTTAADEGAVIHGWIERGFLGETLEPQAQRCFDAVRRALDEAYGCSEWIPEKPFWHPNGFGGRTDILGRYASNDAIVVNDFKTREFDQEDVDKAEKARIKGNKTFGRLTPRESEPLQIAANLMGHMRGYACMRDDKTYGANLYISRKDPTIVWLHKYSHDTLSKSWDCFVHLHEIFKIQRGVEGR